MEHGIGVIDHDPVIGSFGKETLFCATFSVVIQDAPIGSNLSNTVYVCHLHIKGEGDEIVVSFVLA